MECFLYSPEVCELCPDIGEDVCEKCVDFGSGTLGTSDYTINREYCTIKCTAGKAGCKKKGCTGF